ncbi:MAG: restriction endonuclease subunit S, partial [Sphaerospermopsis kisseleviana]
LPPISSDEVPFSLPDGWVWCRLGDIAYVASGSTPAQHEFKTEGIPYFKVYNIVNQKINFRYRPQFINQEIHEKKLKRSQVFANDVLMNIVGPPLGKLAIVPEYYQEANINQALVVIRALLYKQTINQYLFVYLSEKSEINKVETKGVVGQDNISLTQSKNFNIVLPPLAEQKAIVEKVDYLMKQIEELEAQIKHRKQLAEELMQTVLR